MSSSILEFFRDHIQYKFPDEDCKCRIKREIFTLYNDYIKALTILFLFSVVLDVYRDSTVRFHD